jgi:hypothetical protein
MNEGQIVREKITGWKVVLVKKYGRIMRFLDADEWLGRTWVQSKDGGYWEKRYYRECELEEINPPQTV